MGTYINRYWVEVSDVVRITFRDDAPSLDPNRVWPAKPEATEVVMTREDAGAMADMIKNFLVISAPAPTPLADAVAQYSRDIRNNSNGADGYPWEIMKGVADALDAMLNHDILKRRS